MYTHTYTQTQIIVLNIVLLLNFTLAALYFTLLSVAVLIQLEKKGKDLRHDGAVVVAAAAAAAKKRPREREI